MDNSLNHDCAASFEESCGHDVLFIKTSSRLFPIICTDGLCLIHVVGGTGSEILMSAIVCVT